MKENETQLPPVMSLPVLAMRNASVFPVLAIPVIVGREKSLAAISEAISEYDNYLAVFSQKDSKVDDPSADDLYQVGTIVRVVKSVKREEGKMRIIIQGLARIKIRTWVDNDQYLQALVDVHKQEEEGITPEMQSDMDTLRKMGAELIEKSPNIPAEASFLVSSIHDPGLLADLCTSNCQNAEQEDRQEVLECWDIAARLKKSIEMVKKEMLSLELSNVIDGHAKSELDKAHKEVILRERMKAIRKELGEDDDLDDIEEIKMELSKKQLPEDVRKRILKELKRMQKMNPQSGEYTVSRTFIDWLMTLPWLDSSDDNLDIQRASEILEEDHFGLDEPKKRILEQLSVLSLRKDMKAPILCMVGPPGVGKTSLAKSIARAMERSQVRISLGGVRDEAEIRGHRRTYIGSMPGKIIKGMKKAGTNNPVMILDEIDKLCRDSRGDPAAALLEVLDPEQNNSFEDHYLDMPFDLSKVLFIATANGLGSIPGPLRDRMEIIEVSGYTMEEKIKIARGYIIDEQTKEHGIGEEHVAFSDEGLKAMIMGYTREAGVRTLKRTVGSCCRYAAHKVASKQWTEQIVVTEENISEILGPVKFLNDRKAKTKKPGVVTGLAWTAAGGDVLLVEASKMPGKGLCKITGSLGRVMKESISVVMTFIRSHAKELGISQKNFSKTDYHIHFPAGAVPKDGPSAGVTILTALVSLMTDTPVSNELAMTGEASLRGEVLPVGGIKEKVLAAHRQGIKTVLIPVQCAKDLVKIPDSVKEELTIHLCTELKEVLVHAFGEAKLKAMKDSLEDEDVDDIQMTVDASSAKDDTKD